MRILLGLLKYPPDYSGDGLRLHRTMKRLMKRGVTDVNVITSWDKPESRVCAELDGIRIYRTGEYTGKPKFERFGKLLKRVAIPIKIFRVIYTYLKLYRKSDILLLSGSGWFPSTLAWLAILTKKPFVKEIVLLGSDDPQSVYRNKSWMTRWFFLIPFKRAHMIVAISPLLKAACATFGITSSKIWCRFNPVDFQLEDVETVESQPDTHESVPMIFWVGTLSPRKNVDFLLRAAHFLTPPLNLIFVGPANDSEYYQKLLDLRRTLPEGIEVNFMGHVHDPIELHFLYKRANLFWFASKKEGMANAVAEALVCGTPVVTLPVMGIMQQVIPTEQDGEIVDTDDPEEFAYVVEEWLKKKHDRDLISQRSKKRFDADLVDKEYLQRFKRILYDASYGDY